MTSRRIPRWLIWVGVPVACILLAVLLFRWDWLIPVVESRASAALGRPVQIAHLQVRLGRVTEVTATDLTVGNPDGFPADAAPFATAPRATVRFDVMEYWNSRAIVLPLIELERPRLSVQATEDGKSNYSFGSGTKPAGEGAPAESKTAMPRIDVFRVIDGGARVLIPKLRADFNLGIATRDETTNEPRIAVDAKGTYAGQPITGDAVLGGLVYFQAQDRPWPLEMRLANGPTNVSVKGTIAHPLELQGADVQLLLRGTDMALLEPLTGVPFPRTPNYSLGGHLDYADGRARFRDFDGKVGSSDLGGTITVSTGDAVPDVTADLRSKRVDLADLGGFIGETPGRTSTPGQTAQQRREVARDEQRSRVLPDTPVSLPKLTAANIHLKYRADSILGRNIPFDGMRADLDIVDGAIRLHPLSLQVGRGQISGDIALTPKENEAVEARADVQFQRVDLSRLMQATGYQGSGLIGGRAQINGSGKSLAEILGRGNGALTLSMAGGGNLSALLVDLSGLRLGNALLSFLKLPDRTQVECFVGDFTLRSGQVDTRALIVDTEDVLITGDGKVDLTRERINYRIRSESKHFTIGQLPAPITIGGTFRNPDVGIDPTEAAARGGAAAALGILAAPLAILPTIQFGVGDDNRCQSLTSRGQRRR